MTQFECKKDRPKRACQQAALSNLVVGVLQRCFNALLQAGALWLNLPIEVPV
jgi:hypothetical protein